MATGNIPSDILYSDFTTNFEKNPLSKDLSRVTNDDAVKQSIKNLVMTNRGERLFQPELGGDVRALLFSNITPQTLLNAQTIIENLINDHEPRANLIGVVVSVGDDNNSLAITIVFNVINIQEPIQLDLVHISPNNI